MLNNEILKLFWQYSMVCSFWTICFDLISYSNHSRFVGFMKNWVTRFHSKTANQTNTQISSRYCYYTLSSSQINLTEQKLQYSKIVSLMSQYLFKNSKQSNRKVRSPELIRNPLASFNETVCKAKTTRNRSIRPRRIMQRQTLFPIRKIDVCQSGELVISRHQFSLCQSLFYV